MNLANLSGRLAALIAVLVTLAVLLVGWFVLLSPERSKITSLDNDISQTQAEIASTRAYVSSPTTKKAIAQLARLKLMVPDDVRMSQVLRQLAKAASTAGVQLDAITPQTLVGIGTAQAVPIQLTVEGHYGTLGNFMHLLRAQARVQDNRVVGNGRLYSVSGIAFTSGSSTTGSGNGAITATVTVNAFVNAAAPATTASTTITP
jgi:Tfp pilus assembly protein PilO